MKTMPDECVDLIATDLAYESQEKHRATGTTTRLSMSKMSSNPWFKVFPNKRLPELMWHLYRVLKCHRHAYMFCDDETSDILKVLAVQAGFHVWKRLVWDKLAIGTGYHWRAQYEFILFLEKGQRNLNDWGAPDVLPCKRVHKGYPAEKPVELLKRLVRNSTRMGETVLDPFCGSGSAGEAALLLNRRFIGGDISAEAVKATRARLRAIEPRVWPE
jgi:site-specific DNA-methyltransferase (adenine-specific)